MVHVHASVQVVVAVEALPLLNIDQDVLVGFQRRPLLIEQESAQIGEIDGYIIADDVGYDDLSVLDGGFPIPNIDRLFFRGVAQTQFTGCCISQRPMPSLVLLTVCGTLGWSGPPAQFPFSNMFLGVFAGCYGRSRACFVISRPAVNSQRTKEILLFSHT